MAKMFSLKFYRCPACRAEIRQRLEDKEEVSCAGCRRKYRIMLDETSGKAAFVEVTNKIVPEPLYLPRGSIRAGATLSLAVASWILMIGGAPVPDYLFSLLLTVLGYYFGFRKKAKEARSRIFDAAARAKEPLFLPAGVIRLFLIAGFVISGVVVYRKGDFSKLGHLQFFAILAGLVLGYLFAKIFSGLRGTAAHNVVNHVKGLIVLGSAVGLVWLLLTGQYVQHQQVSLMLACAVSFYFGSRS
jgi:hypothetical protein